MRLSNARGNHARSSRSASASHVLSVCSCWISTIQPRCRYSSIRRHDTARPTFSTPMPGRGASRRYAT